jgi:hypothetical protein
MSLGDLSAFHHTGNAGHCAFHDTGVARHCRERRVDGIGNAVKGALTALNAGNAPFTALGMP